MPEIAQTIAAVPARVPTLERVALPAPVFVSDLHLSAQRPRSVQRLLALLASLQGQGAQLVILGDLFEYWAGDDALAGAEPDDQVGAAVARALHELVAAGTPVYLMHGNRDVLLGAAFLQASGAQLLADPCRAQIGSGPTASEFLLSHGDAYCTLDLRYQAFRRQARDAAFQAAFLGQPLAQRRALIGQARAHSEAGKQQMDQQIMDVTPEAVGGALRAAGLARLVHGHTHRPALHRFELDAAPAQRWVLPDWDLDADPPRGGGLRWSEGSLQEFAV